MTLHGALFDGKLDPTATDMRQIVSGLLADVQGVFTRMVSGSLSYSDLQCSAGSGMTTNISSGRGTVLNSFQTTQGGLWVVRNDAVVATPPHQGNSSGNPRWDGVGIRVYDAETGGDSSDQTVPLVITGNASASAATGTGTSRWNLGTANLTGAPGQTGGPALPNNFQLLSLVLVPNGAASSASFSYLDWRLFITGGQQDTGWLTLSLTTNWNVASGYWTPAGRLLGDRVVLRGGATNNTGSSSSVPFSTAFPAALRPTTGASIPCAISTGTSTVVSTLGIPAGNSTPGLSTTVSNGFGVNFDGCNYSLT